MTIHFFGKYSLCMWKVTVKKWFVKYFFQYFFFFLGGGAKKRCITFGGGCIYLFSEEILTLKINNTKIFKGITYAIQEARSELFANDLPPFLERNEENLRNFAKILDDFHTVSGLATNLDKTCLVPVGDFSVPNCWQDFKLKWETSIKVMGIVIDQKNLT